jgi:superfamily I DNA/RNA helicase/DNA polymerase III epsilon subunit-like protein
MIPDPSAQQRKAIESPLGPLLVVAGPGAGKTFCLIARIQHLIAHFGLAPPRICAVTFTNKAAQEVAARLHRTLAIDGQDIVCGTLHSLCLSILRAHPLAAGLREGFGMADEDYQCRLLRRLRVRSERHQQTLNLFGRFRLEGRPLHPRDAALFEEYRAALRSRNLLDFDDLIALTAELLRRNPRVADELSGRWDAVLVDEFQDLNLAQYEILQRLAAQHRNLFVVGDDEQSIFSWTGADPRILQRFRDDFGIVEPVVLDRNRRCSVRIFEVARRLISRNPVLFHKQIDADRESEFEVAAFGFADEGAEAAWIVEDLLRDREATGTSWGEYAILYRKHQIGRVLESRLLEAGVPCRMARGQALMDDEVIAYVVSSLRLISAPDDPVALEAFAERVLPAHMHGQIRAANAASGGDLLSCLRVTARGQPKGDHDTRKLWRFIYHVENLRALRRSHDTLAGLVDELLTQRIGPYRNPLEERYRDLTDPAKYPGASELAGHLAVAQEKGAPIRIEAACGLEVALKAMLTASGLAGPIIRLVQGETPAPGDVVLRRADARGRSWPLLVFKALQLLHTRELVNPFRDYVTFDLETTDRDTGACEIIELAAARVQDGLVVDRFWSLVRCDRPISAGARRVHGYDDPDLCDAPSLMEVWPRFRAFIGQNLLVAHNGQDFDVPVLRRCAAGLPGLDELVFFDSLPLARSLFEESARLGDLARRFEVNPGRSHHALDDALTLALVLGRLGDLKVLRARTAGLVHLLDQLGLAFALDAAPRSGDEEHVFRELALPYILGRYSDCLEGYAEECKAAGITDAPDVEELIERLGGRRLMERIRAERPAAQRYPGAVARLRSLVASSSAMTVEEGIRGMLERVALSSSEGAEVDPWRVSLLTLHSTKGLEFSRVYIAGVEDRELPGYPALEEDRLDEIQEARRLLYVGMTRAKDRLVLTRAAQRGGRPSVGALFLREAGLEPVPLTAPIASVT